MTPEEALELINTTLHSAYSLNAQYSGSEDQGAWRVVDADGTRAVLKLSRNPMWVNQVQRAKAATDHLSKLGYPVPTYIAIGTTDRGTYWLQSMVQGTSAGDAPTAEQLTSLLGLIEKQKGQAISEVQGQDWVWYLTEVVFRGESGYVRTLMQFGPETSSLVARIEGLVTGLQNKELPKTDLVHGDMAINQILFAGRDVSAVLDWDQVGYGDRTIDLVSLWYSLVERNDAQRQVLEHIMTVSEPEIIKIYAVYKMLTSVAGQITKAGGDLPAAVARANAALAVLDSLPKPEPAASAPGATPAALRPYRRPLPLFLLRRPNPRRPSHPSQPRLGLKPRLSRQPRPYRRPLLSRRPRNQPSPFLPSQSPFRFRSTWTPPLIPLMINLV
jgi:aminoglycoside phosphotransferase